MNNNHNSKRTVLLYRALVAFSLVTAAVVCGMGSYHILRKQEDRLFESQYKSIASQAMKASVADMNKKLGTAKIAAGIMSEEFPDESAWPNVYSSGFVRLANLVRDLENDRGLGYSPIVTPDNVDAFEAHAQEQFEKDGFPPSTGNNSFGFGIWGSDPSLDSFDQRYHDNTGETVYNSSYKIMTPILQIGYVTSFLPFLLYNTHSEPNRGLATDRALDCTLQFPERAANNSCGSMTAPLTFQSLNTEPTSLYLHPITTGKNSTVGIIVLTARWSDMLSAVVPDFVNGVDIVVETVSYVSTYTIQSGNEPVFSSGDVHDSSFNSYRKTKVVFEDGSLAPGTPAYTLHFYPRQEFSDQYHTNTPLFASLFAAIIIMLVSFVFLLYDRAVEVESNEQEAILDIKRQFVRFIFHEIRTPMNTVCLGLTLLQSELQAEMERNVAPAVMSAARGDVKDWMALASDVKDNALSAVAVLNDLLNYDRIETGKLDLDVSPLEIAHLVESTVNAFNLQARQAQVTLGVHLEGWVTSVEKCRAQGMYMQSRMQVVGDGVKLTQVVRNLVSNALKFTGAGGQVVVAADWHSDGLMKSIPSKQILDCGPEKQSNSTDQQAGSFVLTVTDSGAGLSKEQLKGIFAEGIQFNVNQLQAGQGSGLGLCIAKGIVEQHGGRLSVSSPGLEKGACFTWEIPVYRVGNSTLEVNSEDFSAAVEVPTVFSKRKIFPCDNVELTDLSLPRNETGFDSVEGDGICPVVNSAENIEQYVRKILVVDDSHLNRKLLCRLLTAQGHQCHEVENGQEAVDKYASCDPVSPFDTILMDSEMPVMNGPDAVKQLRANGCGCLIVGVTGNVLAGDVEYFKSMGANEVLPKPFIFTDLRNIWEDSCM